MKIIPFISQFLKTFSLQQELNLFHHIFQMIVLMSSIDENKVVNQKKRACEDLSKNIKQDVESFML